MSFGEISSSLSATFSGSASLLLVSASADLSSVELGSDSSLDSKSGFASGPAKEQH
jgi:hypothetical protein